MKLLGYKCNMTDIQASILIPQLNNIEKVLRKKKEISKKYEQEFSGVEGLDFPKVVPKTKHARHIFTIWVDPQKRDNVVSNLQEAGIGIAINFRAIHLLTYYKETFGYKLGIYPNAEKIGDSTITLPLYSKMKNSEINYVINNVKNIIKRLS